MDLESGVRLGEDRTEHRERCPLCKRVELRWHSRHPADQRLPPSSQNYICKCGLLTIPLMRLIRCWHCCKWCQQDSMKQGRSFHSRGSRSGRGINNLFCSQRCLNAEREEERRAYRFAATYGHYKRVVLERLRRFVED